MKRIVRPMARLKDSRCVRIILSGVEVMPMFRKGQMKGDGTNRGVYG